MTTSAEGARDPPTGPMLAGLQRGLAHSIHPGLLQVSMLIGGVAFGIPSGVLSYRIAAFRRLSPARTSRLRVPLPSSDVVALPFSRRIQRSFRIAVRCAVLCPLSLVVGTLYGAIALPLLQQALTKTYYASLYATEGAILQLLQKAP